MLLRRFSLFAIFVSLFTLSGCGLSEKSIAEKETQAKDRLAELITIETELSMNGFKFKESYSHIEVKYNSGESIPKDQEVYHLLTTFSSLASSFLRDYDNNDWYVSNIDRIRSKQELADTTRYRLQSIIAQNKETEKKIELQKLEKQKVTMLFRLRLEELQTVIRSAEEKLNKKQIYFKKVAIKDKPQFSSASLDFNLKASVDNMLLTKDKEELLSRLDTVEESLNNFVMATDLKTSETMIWIQDNKTQITSDAKTMLFELTKSSIAKATVERLDNLREKIREVQFN